MYLGGTFDALPKGGILPKQTDLKVRIGPPLLLAEMRRRTEGMARSESYRTVTKLAEEAIRALAAGKVYSPSKLEAAAAARTSLDPTRKSS